MTTDGFPVTAQDLIQDAEEDISAIDLCRRIAVFMGYDLDPITIDSIMWNETGWPGFFDGDPVDCLSKQFAKAIASLLPPVSDHASSDYKADTPQPDYLPPFHHPAP